MWYEKLTEWAPEIEAGKLVYLEICELFLKALNNGSDKENKSENSKGCFPSYGQHYLLRWGLLGKGTSSNV